MPEISVSIQIKASPEEVWALLTDFERVYQWMWAVDHIQITSKIRTGVGVKTHTVMKLMGFRLESDGEVVEWVENKKLGFRATSGMEWRSLLTLEPSPVGTKVTYAVNYKVPGALVGRVIDQFMIRREVLKVLECCMERARALLEGK